LYFVKAMSSLVLIHLRSPLFSFIFLSIKNDPARAKGTLYYHTKRGTFLQCIWCLKRGKLQILEILFQLRHLQAELKTCASKRRNFSKQAAQLRRTTTSSIWSGKSALVESFNRGKKRVKYPVRKKLKPLQKSAVMTSLPSWGEGKFLETPEDYESEKSNYLAPFFCLVNGNCGFLRVFSFLETCSVSFFSFSIASKEK